MAKTNEHIGKIAHMIGGYTHEFIGGTTEAHYTAAGLAYLGNIEAYDKEGILHHFCKIIGECDPSLFNEIITKEEANEMIKTWFVPRYEIAHSEYFKRYLDKKLTLEHLEHISMLEHTEDVYAYLVSEGFKFIKVTDFDGPQFEI